MKNTEIVLSLAAIAFALTYTQIGFAKKQETTLSLGTATGRLKAMPDLAALNSGTNESKKKDIRAKLDYVLSQWVSRLSEKGIRSEAGPIKDAILNLKDGINVESAKNTIKMMAAADNSTGSVRSRIKELYAQADSKSKKHLEYGMPVYDDPGADALGNAAFTLNWYVLPVVDAAAKSIK